MIRIAVGAVVQCGDRYLLVNKKKINDTQNGEGIEIDEWDIPKGGVKEQDQSLEEAVLRELHEETGSSSFELKDKFEEKIVFDFPVELKSIIGFDKQETTMFFAEYVGDGGDLSPIDEEIGEIKFVTEEEFVEIVHHCETVEFLKKNVWN
ncbi:hypothetical protein GCM10008967_20410 [Bacillus carboniphilus]|uniref:Nudix hydrolase domain-containing protein n=1 Tax=Bacillus carboniphilus TaxID=86663 RepID=A0ABN0W9I1_9BACI